MSEFLNMALVALFMGLIDFIQKGRVPWEKVSKFNKSRWRDLLYFIIYATVITLFALQMQNLWYLLGIGLFILEDAGYYIVKYFYYGRDSRKTYWNSWMGIWNTARSYWFTVIIVTLVMLALFLSLGAI